MAKTTKPAPAAPVVNPSSGGTTPPAGGGSGGTPTQPLPATLKDDFIKGNKLRDRSDTVGSEYDKSIDKVNANQDDDIAAVSAAYFDEQGMDPYEVNNAK